MSTPASASSSALRCSGVRRAGAFSGCSTSRGCGSKVTTPSATSCSRASERAASSTARWPRCTPSKLPIATAASGTAPGTRAPARTIRMPQLLPCGPVRVKPIPGRRGRGAAGLGPSAPARRGRTRCEVQEVANRLAVLAGEVVQVLQVLASCPPLLGGIRNKPVDGGGQHLELVLLGGGEHLELVLQRS